MIDDRNTPEHKCEVLSDGKFTIKTIAQAIRALAKQLS